MSLEDALHANTTAVRNLHDFLMNNNTIAKTNAAPTVEEKKAETTKKTETKKTTKTEPVTEVETKAPETEIKAIDYATEIRPLILKLAQTQEGKDAITEILAGFNAKKGLEVKPEDHASLKEKLEALDEATENDLG